MTTPDVTKANPVVSLEEVIGEAPVEIGEEVTIAVVKAREVVTSEDVIALVDSTEVVIGEFPEVIGGVDEVRGPVDMELVDVVISDDVTNPVDSWEVSVVMGEIPVEIGELEEVRGLVVMRTIEVVISEVVMGEVVTGLVVKYIEVISPEVIGPFTTMTVAVAEVAVQFPESTTVTE